MIFYYIEETGQYNYVRTLGEVPEGAIVVDQDEYHGCFWFVGPTGYGVAGEIGSLPEDTTELITQADYDALVAQALADEIAAAQAELEASYQRFRDAYASYRQLGLPQASALTLAAQSGYEPPNFDPTWPPVP